MNNKVAYIILILRLCVKRKVSAKKNGENSTLYYFIRLYVKIKTRK